MNVDGMYGAKRQESSDRENVFQSQRWFCWTGCRKAHVWISISPMSYQPQEDLCMNAGASGYSPALPDVWHHAWNRCKRGQHPPNNDSSTSIWALRTSAPVPVELATPSPLEKDFSQLSLLCGSANMHSLEAREGSLQEFAALFGAFFMLWEEEELLPQWGCGCPSVTREGCFFLQISWLTLFFLLICAADETGDPEALTSSTWFLS